MAGEGRRQRGATAPGGALITLADLPPPDTARWVARRKADVVKAVNAGVLTFEEACRRYQLSREELASWQRAVERHGPSALHVTRLQRFR